MEVNKEPGNRNFYKMCVLGGLSLLTVIVFLIKNSSLGIDWNILGFVGVILTIVISENSRVKQNKYEYKKEKIADEQIEFKHVIKEIVDLLDFSQVMQDFYGVNTTNYSEINLKVNSYRSKLAIIENDIRWYYNNGIIPRNSEAERFLKVVKEFKKFYDTKLKEYNNLVLKLGTINLLNNYGEIEYMNDLPTKLKERIGELNGENKSADELLSEVMTRELPLFLEILKFRNENIANLYKQAHKMIEERDNLMKGELKNIE